MENVTTIPFSNSLVYEENDEDDNRSLDKLKEGIKEQLFKHQKTIEITKLMISDIKKLKENQQFKMSPVSGKNFGLIKKMTFTQNLNNELNRIMSTESMKSNRVMKSIRKSDFGNSNKLKTQGS